MAMSTLSPVKNGGITIRRGRRQKAAVDLMPMPRSTVLIATDQLPPALGSPAQTTTSALAEGPRELVAQRFQDVGEKRALPGLDMDLGWHARQEDEVIEYFH